VVIAENKAGKKALQAHFNFNADIPWWVPSRLRCSESRTSSNLGHNVHCKLQALVATGKRTQSIIQFQAHAIAEDAQAQLEAVRLKNRNVWWKALPQLNSGCISPVHIKLSRKALQLLIVFHECNEQKLLTC
jgi:hypothetical protein